MPRSKNPVEAQAAPPDAWVGTQEAAVRMGVSVSTVQKMVEAGQLRAWRTAGGHRRIAEADLQAANRSQRGGAPGAGQRLQVLVVEDNAVALKLYARLLAPWADRVEMHVAGDAAAALLAIAQHPPYLVVTDLAMQPFDGFHLIRTLRHSAALAGTRMVVVSGLSADEIAARGGLPSDVVFYRKPLVAERFSGLIEGCLLAVSTPQTV